LNLVDRVTFENEVVRYKSCGIV